MKLAPKIGWLAGLVAVAAFASCNSKDPAAMEEVQRLKAEAAALQSQLNAAKQETAAMQQRLAAAEEKTAQATQAMTEAAAAKMPTPEEVEQKLSLETIRLRRAAAEKLPGYKVRDIKMSHLEIPSSDYPFSCRVSMVLEDGAGKVGQLFYLGRGDPKGNWSYEQVEGFPDDKPLAQAPAAGTPAPPPGDTVASSTGASAKPPTPTPKPPPRETPSDALRREAQKQGAMQADQTIIIDLNKLQPIRINPTGANPE